MIFKIERRNIVKNNIYKNFKSIEYNKNWGIKVMGKKNILLIWFDKFVFIIIIYVIWLLIENIF